MKQTAKDSALLSGVLWVLAFAVLGGGAFAYVYFAKLAWGIRAAGALLACLVALAMMACTAHGRAFCQFLVLVRGELRKVAWPSRKETLQSTAMVVVMVIVASLILWALDAALMVVFGWMTGQGA